MLRTRNRAAVLLALVAGLALPGSAQAVILGQFDGNDHPNVGIVVTVDENDGGLSCTGTLIAPSTVLTNAHCVRDHPEFPPALKYAVSFEAEAMTTAPFSFDGLRNPIAGTPDPHPNWTWEGVEAAKGATTFYRYNETDIGLLHLNRPAAEVYPGITPEPIVGAGALNALGKRPKTMITQVGYGVQQEMPPGRNEEFLDGTRNRSRFPLQALRDRVALNHANPVDSRGYGMPCSGDSGSPWFFDGVQGIGVLFSFAQGTCSHGGGPRLDTGPARAFLRSRGLVP